MSYHPPRVYHLSGSVGACGSNNPDDVKAIQQMVNQAGYHLASGRSVRVSGQCDGQTLEAIIWYQRLLNMSPSGLVQPVDTWFMQALKNALEPHWRPRHTAGPLRVREGQITFDAEGLDYTPLRNLFGNLCICSSFRASCTGLVGILVSLSGGAMI